jgi:hypothetical protein
MICGIKSIDDGCSVVDFFIEGTIPDRIGSIIAAVEKEHHARNAEEKKKPEHLQFTISFVYDDSDTTMRERTSQSEIVWTVEENSACNKHAWKE